MLSRATNAHGHSQCALGQLGATGQLSSATREDNASPQRLAPAAGLDVVVYLKEDLLHTRLNDFGDFSLKNML